MIDKQIIDGVDVSKCEWSGQIDLDINIICNSNIPKKCSGYCKDNPNCYYKQLKRKEQSEVKLVGQIQTICDFINNRPEIFKGIYGGVDKIITEYIERKEQECQQAMDNYVQLDLQRVKEYNELVDLYKAKEQECERLKRQYKELGQCSKRLKDYYDKEKETLSNRLLELKQTIAAIKDIAEKIDDSGGCVYGDYNCDNCSSIEKEAACTYKVKKLILQIISDSKEFRLCNKFYETKRGHRK